MKETFLRLDLVFFFYQERTFFAKEIGLVIEACVLLKVLGKNRPIFEFGHANLEPNFLNICDVKRILYLNA